MTVEEARALLPRVESGLDDCYASDLRNIHIKQRMMRYVAGLGVTATVAHPLVSLGAPLWSILICTAFYFAFALRGISQLRKLAKLRRFLELHGVENLSDLKADQTSGTHP